MYAVALPRLTGPGGPPDAQVDRKEGGVRLAGVQEPPGAPGILPELRPDAGEDQHPGGAGLPVKMLFASQVSRMFVTFRVVTFV